MNYIKHLNAVLNQFYKDSRLNPTHISLYISLFWFGNINRFPDTFYINREEVMKLSKIGSKGTYHKCLKQLDEWNYIKYLPSHNPYKGSKIRLLKFDPGPFEIMEEATSPKSGQVVNQHHSKRWTSSEQASGPYINHNKTNTNSINLKKKEVLKFLKNEYQNTIQEEKITTAAEKFFNHNQATGWKIGGTPIKDWQAAAKNWMINYREIEQNKAIKKTKQQNHLKINRNKNYDTPL